MFLAADSLLYLIIRSFLAPNFSLFVPTTSPPAIEHYENFPVASWLCPAHLRAPISAIYHYARTADDLADEGNAGASERIHSLHRYRENLHAIASGCAAHQTDWPAVFGPLQSAITTFDLPVALLDDLLTAFIQDVHKTEAQTGYQDFQQLLAYCRCSANPIGRLLLHLYAVDDAKSLAQSDAICSALQLINFWQDLSVDIPRGRWYLPEDACLRYNISRGDQLRAIREHAQSAPLTALVKEQVNTAKALMQSGQPLVHTLTGRAGWELRLVVQGGLRIADKLARQNYQSFTHRPTLKKTDLPAMLMKAIWMK